MQLSEKLKTLREVTRRVCDKLIKSRRDIVAVLVVGSVARGNIHEMSDVDMCVLIKEGSEPRREVLQKPNCSVDIVYIPLRLWKERLQRDVGSMWEINVSNILDSIVLYDPANLIKKIKQELNDYPEEKRRENILYHFHMIGWYENAVKYHYLRGNYDIESIFSKLFAIEALRILFPLNRVYLKGDKHLFEQVKSLKAPSGFLEKCLSLLWFKNRGVKREEATWIMNTVSELRKILENEIRLLNLIRSHKA